MLLRLTTNQTLTEMTFEMKITRRKLRQIIKEELGDGILSEPEARDLEALADDAVADALDIDMGTVNDVMDYIEDHYNSTSHGTGWSPSAGYQEV